MINAANDLMFEVQGPWAAVFGVLMLALVIYLVYRSVRRHSDRQE